MSSKSKYESLDQQLAGLNYSDSEDNNDSDDGPWNEPSYNIEDINIGDEPMTPSQGGNTLGSDELEFQRQIEEAMMASLEEFNNNKSDLVKDLEDNFGANANTKEDVISNTSNDEVKKRQKPRIIFLATFPLAMYYDYDTYKFLEDTDKCIASNKILAEFFSEDNDSKIDHGQTNINLKIFKSNMNTGVSVSPYEFVIDDNIYIPNKIFEKIGAQPGDYLCFRF